MNVVSFTWSAKFGHFLRAEANANGITYPVPPRTAILGLLGAVLGLEKDEPQVRLASAHVAVGGELPRRFWHKTNVRKDPPAPLPFRIKATDKGTSSAQRNFRFPQEWLWKPSFRVWASLPAAEHATLAARLRERRWHFTPCMGLSEMLADLHDVREIEAEPLPHGPHRVGTLVPHEAGRIDIPGAFAQELTLQSLRMPRAATPDRVFAHRTYWLERQGRPFTVETGEAWQCGPDVVVFL